MHINYNDKTGWPKDSSGKSGEREKDLAAQLSQDWSLLTSQLYWLFAA